MQREYVITTKLPLHQVLAQINQLPRMATGRVSSAQHIQRNMICRIGLATLQAIFIRFIIKRRGAADDTGLRWLPVKPITIRLRQNKKPDILKNLGDLEDSLKPALSPNTVKLDAPPVKLQVFRVGQRQVTVGTRRKFALTHHEGRPTRKPPLPQRRLWPEVSHWTPRFWEGILQQAQRGVIALLAWALRRNP